MAMIPSVVSNVPTLTAGTSGHLGSAVATESAPQPRSQPAVELGARLQAGLEGLVQSTEVVGRLADPGPAAVGRFAATRRTTAPTTKNSEGGGKADARDKDSLLELFAEARPEAGTGVGRFSGGLTRTGRRSNAPGEDRVGRFQPQILPKPRRSSLQPSIGRLSGALSR